MLNNYKPSYMNIAQSLRKTIIISTVVGHMAIQTSTSAKLCGIFMRHVLQRWYDHLPSEPFDIYRKKTLFSQLPIERWTVGCNARIANCLTKTTFWTEVGLHGNRIHDDITKALHEFQFPHDIHSLIAFLALMSGGWLYYLLIKSDDIRLELQKNNH